MNPRAKGMRFEAKVRADLEKKGWIVSKWQNNVLLPKDPFEVPIVTKKTSLKSLKKYNKVERYQGKLVPARQGKYRLTSTGFPDFIVFRYINFNNTPWGDDFYGYYIEGVECKSNGYLSKEEKLKCKWLLDNNIFSKILIASKGKKRGEIIYKEV